LKKLYDRTLPQNSKLKVISLFSGCGGMDLGFEGNFMVHPKCVNEGIHPDWVSKKFKNGWILLAPTIFQTVFANDIREGAYAAWVRYFSQKGLSDAGRIFHTGSIVDHVKGAENRNKSIFPKKADIVTGGFPCQDFSVAGKRKGFKSHKSHENRLVNSYDDPTFENRGMLYVWMRKVVALVKPKIFIAENVKGLISLSDAKMIIEKDFKSIGGGGYLVVPARILAAADYGVPQARERIFFLGFLRTAMRKTAIKELEGKLDFSEYDPYPIRTHKYSNGTSDINTELLLDPVTVNDVLNNLPEPEKSKDLSHRSYSKAKWYGKHCQGQTEVNLNSIGPTIRAEHHGNIEFRRLSKSHGGAYRSELKKGLKERRLTVRECARLQTFPDDYEFVRRESKQSNFNVSASEAYKLIGNAVPPLLAYHIAKRIEALWPKIFYR
jgi:DNA (cytosine-5)-methyltransferase 1